MIWKMPNTFFLSPKINCQTKIEVNELQKKKRKEKKERKKIWWGSRLI